MIDRMSEAEERALCARLALAEAIGTIVIPMPDGRVVHVYMQVMGTARLAIGAGDGLYDDQW